MPPSRWFSCCASPRHRPRSTTAPSWSDLFCGGGFREKPDRIAARRALEHFTVSRKRRTALSLCFYAIPKGKRYALFPGKPCHTFPGIALKRNRSPARDCRTPAHCRYGFPINMAPRHEVGAAGPRKPQRTCLIPFAGSRYFGNSTLLTTSMTPFDWLTSAIVTLASPPDSSMM
ncbi:hypothetical protein FJ976_25380 [Mesorhizobium sp. B1-1-9]|nr:hypothetical protein FJ976_25380 [Mesorhizobium sp. B1-1-9]TPN45744.1 hypothetical protein FJ978_26670 [Mesorhizobium sp. B1-1-7]